MKKQYIAPALFEYTLRIESQILAISPIQKSITDVHVGNKNRTIEGTEVKVPDFKQSELNTTGEAIKWVDGNTDDDITNI